jgi:hypothetical protein
MPLKIKHKTIPNNSNRNIVLTETTGVYSATNLTGYGTTQTPTGTREIADILSSNFNILNYNGTLTYTGSTTPVTTELLYTTNYNSTIAKLIAGGTTQSFDLATLIGVNYVDAVYKSVYYNWFAGIDVVSNNSVYLYSDNYEEAVNIKYIKVYNVNNLGLNVIYEVLNVENVSGGAKFTINGTWNNYWDGDYAFEVAYESTAYFANTYNINKCLHSRISKLAISSCSCDNKCTQKLYEAVMLYMAIQPNIDLGKYQKAQDIIEYLTHYCNDGCCNC